MFLYAYLPDSLHMGRASVHRLSSPIKLFLDELDLVGIIRSGKGNCYWNSNEMLKQISSSEQLQLTVQLMKVIEKSNLEIDV